MGTATPYRRYYILAKRNKKELLAYILSIALILLAIVYLSVQGSWAALPAAFGGGIYSLYILLKIDDLLGISTIAYGAASNISESADKATTSSEIERILESYDIGYHLPDEVEIVWEKEVDSEILLQNDEEIISLDNSNNQNKNAGRAALQFSRRNIVNHVRVYLNEKVDYGLDAFVSEDILTNCGVETIYVDKNKAKGEIFKELVNELDIEPDDTLDQIHQELDTVRDAGFFGPVLLREYSKLSEEGFPTSDIENETRGFLRFLDALSNRSPGEEGKLAYPGESINVGIGIISGKHSKDYYKELALISFAKYDTTYILAEGDKISKAKSLHEELVDRPGVADFDETTYDFRAKSRFNKGYCAQYEVPVGQVSRQID